MSEEKTTIEIWIAIDANGDYEVGTYDEEAIERFESNIQSSTAGIRLIRLRAGVTPPEPTSIDVDVPDEAGVIVDAEVAGNPEPHP